MAVLVAQFEQLRAGERAHRVTLAEIGIDPDLHRLSLQLACSVPADYSRNRQHAIGALDKVSNQSAGRQACAGMGSAPAIASSRRRPYAVGMGAADTMQGALSTSAGDEHYGDEPDRDECRGSRADQRRLSRRRLIEAARALCSEGRFLSCSVGDIASKAELSRAGFYLHFRSKQDLLDAVLSDQLDWYVNQHNTVTEARVATTDGIIGWLRQFVEGFRNAGELFEHFSMATPTRERVRHHQANRIKGVEALGHRIPALRMFRPDGAIDPDRMRKILFYAYQLEQACINLAYEDDPEEADATLLALAEDFQQLMQE